MENAKAEAVQALVVEKEELASKFEEEKVNHITQSMIIESLSTSFVLLIDICKRQKKVEHFGKYCEITAITFSCHVEQWTGKFMRPRWSMMIIILRYICI